MVYLISQVFIDMIPFLILFIYFILAFAFVFQTIDYDEKRGHLNYYLGFSYRMTLGDFDTSDYNFAFWMIFLIATLFNNIIMLNMLISVISGTYERV